eukprot:9099382-Alexandrium_andersonii.AAC.1
MVTDQHTSPNGVASRVIRRRCVQLLANVYRLSSGSGASVLARAPALSDLRACQQVFRSAPSFAHRGGGASSPLEEPAAPKLGLPPPYAPSGNVARVDYAGWNAEGANVDER